MKTNLSVFAAFGLASGLFATGAAAQCGQVTITEMNWASASVVTEVSKFLLEQGLGCAVTKVPTSTVPAVTSVAETGAPDILTELWINSAPLYPGLVAEGKIETVGTVLSDGGVDAWWIPAYLAEAHPELTTIEGILAHPELVGGVFNNAPDGWGVRIVDDNLIKALDFEGHGLKVFNHGSGETLATSIASAYSNKEPWFGYYWAPTSVLGKYPMVQVKIGDFNADIHACNSSVDCATPGISGFPVAEVLTGVTTDFAAREPRAAALIGKVTFSNELMGSLLAWQEANSASGEETAVHFLTENTALWSEWIDDEAKANLSALLPQ